MRYKEIDLKKVEETVYQQTITIAKNVKTLRAQCGITQQDLAFKVHMDKSRISDIENGRAPNMTMLTLQKLATFFRVQPGDLMRDW